MTGADTAKEQAPSPGIPLDLGAGAREETDWESSTIADPEAADGVHPIVFHKPKVAVLAIMDSALAGPSAQMAAVSAWMPYVFDLDTQEYLGQRLDDETDDFDLIHVVAIGNWLLEHWGAGERPTGRSGGSRKRSQKTGRRSTGR